MYLFIADKLPEGTTIEAQLFFYQAIIFFHGMKYLC
jgi:hypothetical protein